MSNKRKLKMRGLGHDPDRAAAVSTIDPRIVYGARCVWWDSINAVSSTDGTKTGLPCCPHCGSVLFEVADIGEWWAAVDKYQDEGHPGYRRMIEWTQGRCFPNIEALEDAYAHRLDNLEGDLDGD